MKKTTTNLVAIILAVIFMLTGTAAILTLQLSPASGIPFSFYFYLTVSLLSASGALIIALTAKNEVIVYKEKREAEQTTDEQGRHDHTASLNLKALNENIRTARNSSEVIQKFLQTIAGQLQAGAGAFYLVHNRDGTRTAVIEAGYAIPVSEKNRTAYDAGDGLIGQLIVTGKPVYLDEIPDGYIKIVSGLGSSSPRYVFMCPVLKNNEVAGVIELASFTPLTPAQRKQVEEACQLIAEKIQAP